MQRTSFVCESIVRARRSVISEFPLAMALLALAFAAASCTTASQDAANDATKSTPQGDSQRATSGAATSDASASRRDRLLITAADLASAIASDGLRVLDVRPAEDFSAGHIPGAQRIDIEAWKEAIRGGRHADEEHWAKTIGELGITRDTRVVVYGSEPTSTARAWWTLAYVGVKEPAILDGGFEAWREGGHPVARETTSVEAVRFEPDFQEERLARAPDIRSAIGDEACVFVDTRSDAEVDRGVVPGARHLEWKDLIDADGKYRPVEELRALFADRGIEKGKTLIPYCQSGGRASVEAFALELAGYGKAKTYAGSWGEWSSLPDAPIGKKGEAPPSRSANDDAGSE